MDRALVASVLAYERGPGTWTPAEVACAHTALSQPASHLWLFSSSQAIEHLIESKGTNLGELLAAVSQLCIDTDADPVDAAAVEPGLIEKQLIHMGSPQRAISGGRGVFWETPKSDDLI